ncbi:MAG: hypothetical protein KBS35_01620 [Mycoplasma sp.]|nr:hypothetical protein [Candidatus Hennigella equi]
MTKKPLLNFDGKEIAITILLFFIMLVPGIIYLAVKTPLGKDDIIGLLLFVLGIIPGIIYFAICRKK